MPVITMEGPPVADLEKKRQMTRAITRAAAELYGLPEATIIILYKENTPENVSVGGELIIDRR